MNDLLDFIDELETLHHLEGTPAFEDTIDRLKAKYSQKVADFEAEMEKQYVMEFGS